MTLKEALKKMEEKADSVDYAMNDHDVAQAEVGEAIRKERKAKHISLRAFAAQVGVSPSFISDIENGNRFPSYQTLEKIKKELTKPVPKDI